MSKTRRHLLTVAATSGLGSVTKPQHQLWQIEKRPPRDHGFGLMLRAKFEIRVRFCSNTQSRHHAHTQELTTEEIQELQSQQHTEVMQVIGFEESEEEVISTSEIKEILGMWERVSQFVEKKIHPEKVATGRASDLFNDTCLTHFRNILRGRKKQTSLDMFFSKRPTGESEKNVVVKAKTSEGI
ncbi:hypothetical protein LAZ67_16000129 [Cordylochernes scorpioides]|uniref:Uncharacterized protein n=1 Tax=Cordylochernes scorpioides TaxID=51811 RepID=A0ABY6LAD8_9ARAC|nr:hypothetical protein LAZ67_16000129 [Cordylochernes scorpioides]